MLKRVVSFQCILLSIVFTSLAAQKTAVICGAGGFIGNHLVNRYKQEGYWVRGVDIKYPEFGTSQADEFMILDLRNAQSAQEALTIQDGPGFDELCQLAANMGGMGFIAYHDAEIMHDSCLINIQVLHAAHRTGAKKILFTSSACVYPLENQSDPTNPSCVEDTVYPAHPDTEYGWEKLFAERLFSAYASDYSLDVRIVRLHNIFGPLGTWNGGREKAPAALCRKVVQAQEDGTIEIWGDGDQTRSFLYIDECIEGIWHIMQAERDVPILNLGSQEMISINDLAQMIAGIAKKSIRIKNIPGPEGVRGRNSDNRLIYATLKWQPIQPLYAGLSRLYNWIDLQVENEKYEHQIKYNESHEPSTNKI